MVAAAVAGAEVVAVVAAIEEAAINTMATGTPAAVSAGAPVEIVIAKACTISTAGVTAAGEQAETMPGIISILITALMSTLQDLTYLRKSQGQKQTRPTTGAARDCLPTWVLPAPLRQESVD